MARATFESNAWIPEEPGSPLLQRIATQSAVEAVARRIPMNSDAKVFPRTGGIGLAEVAKGAAYSEVAPTVGDVTLTAKKFGSVVRIAEEDIDDSVIDLINVLKGEWGSSYAKFIDNACLGVSAAVGTGVPFTSVYRAVTTNDSDTGYTANANRIQTAGDLTYADLMDVVGLAEASSSYEDTGTVIIAHPQFKGFMRKLVDGQQRPLFQEGQGDLTDTVLGRQVRWSLGARTNATASDAPSGNPLLIVGPASGLMLGVRSGPESVVIDGRDGASALTDETLLKLRARRAFRVAYPDSFAVLEKTAA